MKYKKNDILKYTGKYADICRETGYIDPVLYDEYGVKRGLRDKTETAFWPDLLQYLNQIL